MNRVASIAKRVASYKVPDFSKEVEKAFEGTGIDFSASGTQVSVDKDKINEAKKILKKGGVRVYSVYTAPSGAVILNVWKDYSGTDKIISEIEKYDKMKKKAKGRWFSMLNADYKKLFDKLEDLRVTVSKLYISGKVPHSLFHRAARLLDYH